MLAQNWNLAEKSEGDVSQNARNLQAIFAASSEWLLGASNAQTFAVQTNEIEVSTQSDKLFLSCLTQRGWQTWHVLRWEQSAEKLTITTARKLTRPSETLEFTRRILIEELRADVNAARLAEAKRLAEIARRTFSNQAKIERVSLNQSNQRGKVGTIARILLVLPNGKTVAVCGSIVEKTVPENLLSNAILWFTKLQEKRKIREIWLVAEEKAVASLQKLHALLRDGWRQQIKICERLSTNQSLVENNQTQIGNEETLSFVELLSLHDLWREKPKKLTRPKSSLVSQTALKLIEVAPNQVDVIRTKHGETLRFNGLPFLRIREVLGEELIWFGVETKSKKQLNKENLEEFGELIDQLREHRHCSTSDKRNALYKTATENWLEAILRRDVSRLDPNLILAPLHAQFRLSNRAGALDLLALRTDGRLVVVELKTSADREHVFQAADYWRQIELQRRAGNITKAKLFSDLEILDEPPLVYLVAPLMSFHHDFDILATAISPEIEIWRFDLNEDWRAGIRVARRADFTKQTDIQCP